MEELADDLQRVAEGPAGPPVRCRALEALFWFQVTASPHTSRQSSTQAAWALLAHSCHQRRFMINATLRSCLV